jgi:5-methylcytosine-specific restriction enzyme subunit McrC
VPDEAAGKLRFRDFVRDEGRMHYVFERFLFNFYRHEQTAFRVSRPTFGWTDTAGMTPDAQQLLPTLNPDVRLTRPGRTIILDAKYYL